MSEILLANDEKLGREAFERNRGEMAALTQEEVLLPTLDVPHAVTIVLGALGAIKALREPLMKVLSDFDGAAFDKLEDYALGLSRAQALYQMATDPPDEIEALFEEGSSLRERLVASARALALSGLFDQRKLEQLKHGNGFSNVAQDLQALGAAFEANWANITGKTAISLDDVETASRVGVRLMRLLGARETGPAAQAEATDNRRRAFTLLARTYEETRAALRYVRRREGDADTIAPTLYPSAGGRRRQSEDATTAPAGTATAPATANSPATPPVATHPAAPANGATPAVTTGNGAPAPVGPFTA